MIQENKNPNPVVPEPVPFEVDEGEYRQHETKEKKDPKQSKGPEPTLESGERRSMMERPDAQDQKI